MWNRLYLPRFVAVALIVLGATQVAEAQLFGQRTLGTPLSRRPKPGTEVGAASGSERYIRGNRSATDFIGSDTGDPSTFVGASQGTTTGRVPTAVENLQRRQFNAARANPVRPQRRPNQMYEPRLELGFVASEPPVNAILARLSQALQTPDGRFDGVEVQVSQRTATLRGIVGSNADKSLAEALVRFEPGISDVRNELVVPRRLKTRDSTPPLPAPPQ
jgi:hypothetical protein